MAMMPLDRLGPRLALGPVGEPFADRDAIKARIAGRLVQRTTDDWMAALRAHDIWCAPVLDWPALLASDAFARLGMRQRTDVVTRSAERRVGTECVGTCRTRWKASHYKTKNNKQ